MVIPSDLRREQIIAIKNHDNARLSAVNLRIFAMREQERAERRAEVERARLDRIAQKIDEIMER